jgi:hypothetical protein
MTSDGSKPPSNRYTTFDDRPFAELASDPEFRITVEAVAAEKKAALADPGPPWREWFLRSALKWYLGLGFLIVDGILFDSWLVAGLWQVGLVSLALALYAEVLVWQYLWYRPAEVRPGYHRAPRRLWIHPVRYGRWTPEADLARHGGTPPIDQPEPSEFL